MTELNLQQYKYRRNFPYNDTIKEDSAENLSENKSTITYNCQKPKGLINQVMMRQIMNFQGEKDFTQGHEVYNKEKMISQEIENDSDKFFNMKSEHLIRNFNDHSQNNEIIYVNNINNNFGKQSSERIIRSSLPISKKSFKVKYYLKKNLKYFLFENN